MRTMGEIPFQKTMALLPTKYLKGAFGAVRNEAKQTAQKIAGKFEKDALGRITVAETKNAAKTTAESSRRITQYGKTFLLKYQWETCFIRSFLSFILRLLRGISAANIGINNVKTKHRETS